MKRVLILGCGYVGLALGRLLRQAGHAVWGTRRHAGGAPELEAAGIVPLTLDIRQLDDLRRLPGSFEWIVNCVAAGQGGAEAYERTYLGGNRNLVTWLQTAPPEKLVYTSSTGVYGQTDHGPVTEESPAAPSAGTAQVLLAAEHVLRTAARDAILPAVVLRVAGIYGPGRGYWLKQFLRGEARLEGDGRRVLNMIHRDDVAGALAAALVHGDAGQTYNVVDDAPVTQAEFFGWLAGALRLPLPPAAPVDLAAARGRGLTSKRVLNHRLKADLKYQLRYPTFRDGLAEEIAAWRSSGALPA